MAHLGNALQQARRAGQRLEASTKGGEQGANLNHLINEVTPLSLNYSSESLILECTIPS